MRMLLKAQKTKKFNILSNRNNRILVIRKGNKATTFRLSQAF